MIKWQPSTTWRGEQLRSLHPWQKGSVQTWNLQWQETQTLRKSRSQEKQVKWRWGEPKTITDNTANHINKPFTDRACTINDALGPSTHSHHQLIIDTSCTGHFLSTTAPIKNKTSTTEGIQVRLPNQDTMTATHTAELDLLDLPLAMQTAHIFPALGTTSLLSVGQLCDANCMATFTDKTVTITHNNKTILSGQCNKKTNLWNINMPKHKETSQPETSMHNSDATESAHNVNQTHKTAELVAFAHAAFFSPANSTLQQALDKNYVNHFPGLTSQSLHNHPTHSIATVKCHLDQSQKNQCSIKPTATFQADTTTDNNENNDKSTDDNYWPTSDPENDQTHHCFAACTEDHTTGKIFMDQTGCFIIPSSTGHTQMFILYDYDSNSIQTKPIKNRSAPEILQAYKLVTTMLTDARLKPKLHLLDNKCSTLLVDHMKKQGINFQLVPTAQHWCNAAECTIWTFKNHFIGSLCTMDKNFPSIYGTNSYHKPPWPSI